MSSPEGADLPTEPADSFATRAPSPDTVQDVDRLAQALGEEAARDRGDDVAVVMLVDRPGFERALLAYGLMEADTLGRFLDEFPDGECPADAVGLARALVGAGTLTRYQASVILQGKAKVLAIGSYVVLDRLGSGGMGLVFRARHRASGDVVALKLLPPSASKQEQSVLRFRREARIMAQLAHANIVASREIGEHNGLHYLVMDHVEGVDLHRMVRSEGPLGVRHAVECVIQAARGLAEAHQRGIVHRDIKPANLMVDPEGVVRVLDLGLARITHAEGSHQPGEPDPSLTHHGMIMGTVDFLPPEQSNNSKLADHRADVYSLGCTLHYLLAGKPPFVGETIMERLLAHHQQPVPSLLSSRPDVPQSLDVVFRRMLEKEPGRRPQSMSEVIRCLETALVEGWGEIPLPEPVDALASGRVAADRRPEESDLSGYEVLIEARSPLWSPLLDGPSAAEVPPAVERKPKPVVAPAPPSGLEPSARRWWVGLVLLGLLGLVIVMGVVAIGIIAQVVKSFANS